MKRIVVIVFIVFAQMGFSQSTLDRTWSEWKTDTLQYDDGSGRISVVKSKTKGLNRSGYYEIYIGTTYTPDGLIEVINKGKVKSVGTGKRIYGVRIYYDKNGKVTKREKYNDTYGCFI